MHTRALRVRADYVGDRRSGDPDLDVVEGFGCSVNRHVEPVAVDVDPTEVADQLSSTRTDVHVLLVIDPQVAKVVDRVSEDLGRLRDERVVGKGRGVGRPGGDVRVDGRQRCDHFGGVLRHARDQVERDRR